MRFRRGSSCSYSPKSTSRTSQEGGNAPGVNLSGPLAPFLTCSQACDSPLNTEACQQQIRERLGDAWLPRIYRERILKLRTRSYHFEIVADAKRNVIQHTLLGVELKLGRKRLLCPDLATARYLSVFARLGCQDVAVPYDITRISQLADELESSWYRMLLLVDQEATAFYT